MIRYTFILSILSYTWYIPSLFLYRLFNKFLWPMGGSGTPVTLSFFSHNLTRPDPSPQFEEEEKGAGLGGG